MFEGLLQNLHIWGDKLETRMCAIEDKLVEIAGNTEAALNLDRRNRKGLSVAKESTGTIRNDSGYGWLITLCWISGENVRVALGTEDITDTLFNVSGQIEAYVPPGGVLFIVNAANAARTVTIQYVELETAAKPASTGTSNERMDRPRVEPVPSGTPLDTPVAP